MTVTPISVPEQEYDLAVVGAGPAGCAAAAALAAAGWRTILIERGSLPRHKVCGEFLSPEAQATLRNVGLYADLAALAPQPLTSATITSRSGKRVETPLPGAAWGVSRYGMDAALANAFVARGGDLLTKTTVTAIAVQEEGAVITLRSSSGQRQVRARAVIKAAGRRPASGIAPASTTRTRRKLFVGMKCHMTDIAMPERVELYLFAGGYVGINRIETGAVNVSLLIAYDAFTRAGPTLEGVLESIGHQNEAFAGRIRTAQLLADTRCTVAAIDTSRPATPWLDTACVGDAATMIPPLCGDGMAMALRSAELCRPFADGYLRGKLTLTAWRDAYRSAWHGEFDYRLRMGRLMQGLLGQSHMADLLIGTSRHVPWLAGFAVRATRGSTIPAASVHPDHRLSSTAG